MQMVADKNSAKFRVLVVDDSLFMRRLISDMLNSDPQIKVMDTAKDGAEALEKIQKIRPDCVTLDIAMPGWDGLTTLKHIMDEYPTPVIILSAHSRQHADITMKCLNAGAVGFVLKPSGELSLNIESIKNQLLEEVKAASTVSVESIKTLITETRVKPARRKIAGANKIIVIGASTGGPQALEEILPFLPQEFPIPVIVVQHMPSRFFTESLAEHLNKISELEVKIAEDNEVIQSGKVYIAPAESSMILQPCLTCREAQKPQRRADNAEPQFHDVVVCLCKIKSDEISPSIDTTMKSVAEIYNGDAVGIILSGMGRDGVEGMRAIKESSGRTIVQDESSLIFGMPKAVIEAGCADNVLGVREIASAMVDMINIRENYQCRLR